MNSDSQSNRPSFRRRHKLAGQSLAFVGMMGAPALMYIAAQAGAGLWLGVGFAAMAASMALAMWIS